MEEHWPRAGEPWIPGSALFCVVVNSRSHFPHVGLSSSSKDGGIFSETPFCNSITFLFDRSMFGNV